MKLHISDTFALPLEAVTQTFALLAKRRAGKSYLAMKLVEQLWHAKQQVVVLDPKGDSWGLRSSADGKGDGIPIVILGGEHGDVKLEPAAGEVIARLVVEDRVSAVLDLSEFRKHEVATFCAVFLETLYRLKAREQYRTAMMLMIDEADAVAPQRPMRGEERMLGAAEDIVRRGGQRGIGCLLATQRAAVLNKNCLTQAQILVALRTIAPQDLDAMNAWVDVHGTTEQRRELMASLPSLPVGTAWFWSPGWPTEHGIFQRVAVGKRETLDSGATPKPGQAPVEPKRVADVDLSALTVRMAATIERAKADDPKELRKEIATLKRELAAKPAAQAAEVKTVEVPIISDATLKRLDTLLERLASADARAEKIAEEIGGHTGELRSALLVLKNRGAIAGDEGAYRVTACPVPARSETRRVAARMAAHVATQNGDGKPLPPGERAVLVAVAQFGSCRRKQLTVLAGYKRSSRDAYINRLQAKGFVEVAGDLVVPTDAGVGALGAYDALPTGSALADYWLNRLPGGEREVLAFLLKHGRRDTDRAAIDDATGYKRSSRDAYLNRLTAKQIVVAGGRGTVRVADELFD